MAATLTSVPLYFMFFWLCFAFSISTTVHPISLVLNGCYMAFVNGGDGILCGFSEIYLDHAVRLRAGKRILTSDFHRTGKAFVKTTKRGLTSLAIPGYDPPFEITIFMDISVNPGPVSKLLDFMSASTPPIHQPLHLHINHSSIIYSRSQLLSIRAGVICGLSFLLVLALL